MENYDQRQLPVWVVEQVESQIISPAGRLPLKALSLRRKTKVETCAETSEHALDITIF